MPLLRQNSVERLIKNLTELCQQEKAGFAHSLFPGADRPLIYSQRPRQLLLRHSRTSSQCPQIFGKLYDFHMIILPNYLVFLLTYQKYWCIIKKVMILSMKELLFSRTKTTRFFIGFPVRPSQGVRGIFVFRTKSRPGNRTESMRQSRKRKKPEPETRSRTKSRHRQKHKPSARSGKNRNRWK